MEYQKAGRLMMEHVADDGVNALLEFHLPLVAD